MTVDIVLELCNNRQIRNTQSLLNFQSYLSGSNGGVHPVQGSLACYTYIRVSPTSYP